MTNSTSDEFLAKGWAALEHSATDLQLEVAMHTVALHFFKGRPKNKNLNGHGSGVLLAINKRCFILTAGHCVQLASDGPVSVTIDNRPHDFEPQFIVRASRHQAATEVDFGYFELSPSDRSRIEARQKLFLSEARTEVLNLDQCLASGAFFVIGGYPAAFHQHTDELPESLHTGFLTYCTVPSGVENTPPSTIPRTNVNHHVIDLLMPQDTNIRSFPAPSRSIDPPDLSGVSGGGCWIARTAESPANWKPSQIRIVGIHVASSGMEMIQGHGYRFFREVLIGHHLHLIAESDPTMRPYIEAKWPNIADFPI